MNKKIRRIVTMALVLTAFSGLSPVRYLKIFDSSIAYASSDDDDDEKEAIENSYLSDLDISEGKLQFSEKKTEYTVKIDSSDDEITVTAKAKSNTDKIKIDGSDVSLDSNNKAEKTLELNKGRNLIKIKIETKDYGIRTYNLVVNRGSASNSDSSNSNDSDGVYLDSINLSDGNISFSKDKMAYDVNVNSSIDEIRIAGEPEDDDYEVKIDGISVDKDEEYRRTINLVNGKNIIPIDIQDNEGNEQTYTLNVYRGGTTEINTSEVIDNTQDPIYLDNIVIEDGDIPIKFKPKVTTYGMDVKDTYDSIIIKAEPEYDDLVRINGSTAEDPYRKKVDLKNGKNVIEIKVNNSNTYDKNDDEYEERIYTLTVYRGTSEGTAQNSQIVTNGENTQVSGNSSNSASTTKINQWTNDNGKWQYYDSTGNSFKNAWYYDRNYGKNYYFNNEGNMVTGWTEYNNDWYYLDKNGAMATGWVKDLNENWYYLYETGVMAKNTTIGGYKLNSSGGLNN